MDFVERLKGFLLKPHKTFKKEQKTDLMNAFKYGITGLAILGVLTAIVTVIFGSSLASTPYSSIGSGATIIIALLGTIIMGFIGLIIFGAWLHLWVYILGGRKGIVNTIKIIFYAHSPFYILGWVPFISFAASIWTLILMGVGLIHLQKLSTGRAIAAIVLAIIIPTVLIVALIAWVLIAFGPSLLSMSQLSPMG